MQLKAFSNFHRDLNEVSVNGDWKMDIEYRLKESRKIVLEAKRQMDEKGLDHIPGYATNTEVVRLPKNICLFVDDIISPETHYHLDEGVEQKHMFVWVISYHEAIQHMILHGCPQQIDLDYDLNGGIHDGTGLDIAEWMIQEDIDKDGKFFPENFEYFSHSGHPTNRMKIINCFKEYFASKKGKNI